MINEDTEVIVLGFPDPFSPYAVDFKQRCALKDSLLVIKNYLEESNLSEEERLYYDFSVLYIGDEESYSYLPLTFNLTGKDKLVYSYDGENDMRVGEEFQDILQFTDDLRVEVIKK
ncbi:MAG: hypothetical protein IKM20_06425 [Erysipelotrichales bacterium]|nr:hypothetical protein [Erysipelotrichales bacterium]